MTIDNEDWGQIKSLFERALEMPSDSRADFVRAEQKAKTNVRETVLGMLEHTIHANDADIESSTPTSTADSLTTPMEEAAKDDSEKRTIARVSHDRIIQKKLRPGMLIEHFQLIKVLGRGGMGAVFLAEQFVPMRRYVALKVVRDGFISNTGLRRFEAERQSLAMMDHPSIAHVLEAGTLPDGNPYFAMEFIDGQTLVDYCDEKSLTIRERIKLFIRVVEGVQHAHQKGVIHRDLKPSNIMVRERDGIAEPKIIDFGIAKAVSDDVSLGSEKLTVQNAMIGTPAYMSPEQASGQPIDIRTDVYALCMVLYELLTGGLPFDPSSLDQGNPFQNLYMIHSGDIRAPSSRISKHYGDPVEVASLRKTTPKELSSHLKSDLDWIVLKGLAPDREERYPAASKLVEDLWNYLDNKPVSARPSQPLYKVRKFVSRHRSITAAIAVAVFAIIGGITAGAIGYYQSVQANKVALAEKDKAQAINTFLLDMLSAADPHGGDREIKVVDVLDDASTNLADQFNDQPEVKIALYNSLVTSLKSLGKYEKALRLSEEGLEWGQPILGLVHPDMLELRNLMGEALGSLSRFKDAIKEYQFVLETTAEGDGRDLPVRFTAFNNMGVMRAYTGSWEEGCEFIQRAYEGRKRIFSSEHPKTIGAMSNWAACLMYSGQTEDALPVLEEMFQKKRELYGLSHPSTLVTMENLAHGYEETGRIAEAIQYYRNNYELTIKAFGIEHSRAALAGLLYAKTLAKLRNYALATEIFEAVQAGWGDSAVRIRDEVRFKTVQNQAELLLHSGLPDQGLALVDAFQERLKQPYDEEEMFNTNLAFFILRGRLLAALGKEQEARHVARRVFDKQLAMSDAPKDRIDTYMGYARTMMLVNPEEALRYIQAGLAIENVDSYDWRTLKSVQANTLLLQGKISEALEEANALLKYWDSHSKWEDFFLVLRILTLKTQMINALDLKDDLFYERHLREISERLGPESGALAEFEYFYALYLMHHARFQTAQPRLERSLNLLKETHGPDHPITKKAQTKLAELYEALGDQPQKVDLQQN